MENVSNSEIAKSMHVSPQAIFKIREKLEHLGIIKGYTPIIDFKKIGINVMLLMVVSLTSKMWQAFSDDQITERISKAPYVINAYRVGDESATHILLLAFKDTAQKEKYVSEVQTRFADEVSIKATYTFSVDRIILNSSIKLLSEIIEKKDFSPDDLFLDPPDKD